MDATLTGRYQFKFVIKCMTTTQSFTVTLKQQLILLSLLIVKNSILAGAYIYYFGWDVPTRLLYYVFAFLFLIDILPTIVVHIQYLIKNWKCVLTIDTEKRILRYGRPGTSREYSFDGIHSLHYYVSYGRGTGVYSFESYRYVRIILNDGSQIIITCLMVNKIEKRLEQLTGIEMEKHLRVVALITGKRPGEADTGVP